MPQKTSISHYVFHLSYDIIMPDNVSEDEKSRIHLKLKTDLVWEILINIGTVPMHAPVAQHKKLLILSPVASTIIFESLKDYDWWKDFLTNYFSGRMYFCLSEIKSNEDNLEYYAFTLQNQELENNFQTQVVDSCVFDYNGVKKSNRVPSSRVNT